MRLLPRRVRRTEPASGPVADPVPQAGTVLVDDAEEHLAGDRPADRDDRANHAEAADEDTVELRRTGSADLADAPPAHATAIDTVRARRRFVRRRWAARWLAWRRVVVPVLLVGLLAGSVWLVFLSSALAVSGVRVEGTRVLSADAVRRAADVPMGTPLATADLDTVTARIRRLPAVRSVDVSRAWPDQVRIDVTERQVVALVAPPRAGGRFDGTDADGVVFRSYPRRPRGVPVIRTDGDTGTEALSEAATVSGSLPPAIAAKVAEVSVRTVDTISLQLRDGRTVRWGSADESATKARVLAVLLRQKASFYDVSVPGRPVLRRR